MTRLTVAIFVESLDQALADADAAKRAGADLVEYRIDDFTDEAEVVKLIEQTPIPCVLTCRPTWEGGHYDGDDQARVALLEHAGLGERAPEYVDVELATYQRSANLRQKVNLVIDHPGQVRETTTRLILSSHDFEQKPADLWQRIEAMNAAVACRVNKVAWKAGDLRDNIDAFELLLQARKPTVALCMGEHGLASRVLAKKFGAFLTFAALRDGEGTAPGQPTIDDIRTLYRWDAVTPETNVFGVIGHPVGHSMSPPIHNAGFDAIDYGGVYLPMPIDPSYEAFQNVLDRWLGLPALHFRGASVTIPHKENLLRYVREHAGEVDPLAEQIGAANTLAVRDDGSLFACNTDYDGAMDSVCAAMDVQRDDLKGVRVGVIGAGGAARAVVAGFAHHGATVVIYNRTKDKADRLAEEFGGQSDGKVVAAALDKLCDSCCQVFVNCTPVGMHPHVDSSPVEGGAKSFGEGTVVFDTIYNPMQTKLLREAAAAGCTTIQGTEMFVRQAAAQFTLWTQNDAPLEVFRDVMIRRLG